MTVDLGPLATAVEVGCDSIQVALADGRVLAVPLVWFPRLLKALPEERQNWELIGEGEGIHWPGLDEDISVAGLLRGERSAERMNR
jgi:hypothetical protein